MLAEGTVDHVKQLQGEVEAYTGASSLVEPQLWMRVEGPDISVWATPVSILTAVLDALRKGIQSIAEFNLTGALGTRPKKKRTGLCGGDFRAADPAEFVVRLQPRFRIAIALSGGDHSLVVDQGRWRIRPQAWVPYVYVFPARALGTR
ncbi:MAG: hypothetical protein HY319_00280 [Armatimonadetes bacterium]|nr:hypothetical protein [Armatimonadota bacterium]